jgi:hypothetical protein
MPDTSIEQAFANLVRSKLGSAKEQYERLDALAAALDPTRQRPLPQIDRTPQKWWRNLSKSRLRGG